MWQDSNVHLFLVTLFLEQQDYVGFCQSTVILNILLQQEESCNYRLGHIQKIIWRCIPCDRIAHCGLASPLGFSRPRFLGLSSRTIYSTGSILLVEGHNGRGVSIWVLCGSLIELEIAADVETCHCTVERENNNSNERLCTHFEL